MKSTSLNILLIAACLVFTAPQVWSRDQDSAESKTELSFRTLLLSGSFGDAHPSIRNADGSFLPVPTSGMSLSRTAIPYQGPNPIVFYLEGQAVASVQIPGGMKEAILLFEEVVAPEEKDPRFRVIPIPADAEQFPPGSYLFFNFTDLELAADIDSNPIRLAPGDQKLLVLSHEKNSNIAARFSERRDGEWRRSYQLAWYFKPSSRSMVFLTRDDDVDRSLRLRTVSDRHAPPMPPPEEETGK